MKTNANLKKSSMIYFQLGLIVAMLTTLFVLEYEIETVSKEKTPPIVLNETDTEIIDLKHYEIIANKPPVEKPVAKKVKVQPKVKQPMATEIEVVKHEVTEPVESLPTQDSDDAVADNSDNNLTQDNSDSVGDTNASVDTNKVYAPFQIEYLPMFPACQGLEGKAQKQCFEEQLYKYLKKNLKYPKNDYRENNQGVATVEFVIDEYGNFSSIKALDNGRATADMQKAAIQAVEKLPQITPAKQGNTNVRVKYTIPVSFKIQ